MTNSSYILKFVHVTKNKLQLRWTLMRVCVCVFVGICIRSPKTTVLEPNSACCLILYVKFYWNTVNKFIYIISPAVYMVQLLNWEVRRENRWPSDSKSFSSVQSLSHVQIFATPWIAACQASLSITNSRSLSKLMSMEWVMPSSHLIFCHPLLLLPLIPPNNRVFSNESTLRLRWPKYWSFSFSI